MNQFKFATPPLLLASVLVLASCSGGEGGTGGVPSKEGVTPVSVGTITGFGSVFVNGIEFMTDDNSTYTLDGKTGSEDNLGVGMVVAVEGSIDSNGKTGAATHIAYTDELEGIVQAVNITKGTGTLTVMGQTVKVDGSTSFKSQVASVISLDTIVTGNIVEVSGNSAGDGTIYATRVEVKKDSHGDGEEIEVKGIIKSLNPDARTFMLGTLTVDYSNAQFEGLANNLPADNLYVEVKSTQGIQNDVLLASKIELKGDGTKGVKGEEGKEMELEGTLTDVNIANGTIQVNGQTILLAGTQYENGSETTLGIGLKVKVEGHFNADGVLVADKIQFRNEAALVMVGNVGSVDIGAGTITVFDRIIMVNALTIMEDDVGETRKFSIHDLNSGMGGTSVDRVEVQAYNDGTNLVATKLVRVKNEGSEKLVGQVDEIVGSSWKVAGIVVVAGSIIGTLPVITVGQEVELSGNYTQGQFVATAVDITASDPKSPTD